MVAVAMNLHKSHSPHPEVVSGSDQTIKEWIASAQGKSWTKIWREQRHGFKPVPKPTPRMQFGTGAELARLRL